MDINHTQPYELLSDSTKQNGPISRILLLKEFEQTYIFYNIDNEPLLSINRNFSAPVYIQHPISMEDLNVLSIKDSDPFNRWNANNNNSNNDELKPPSNTGYILYLYVIERFPTVLRPYIIIKNVTNLYKIKYIIFKKRL